MSESIGYHHCNKDKRWIWTFSVEQAGGVEKILIPEKSFSMQAYKYIYAAECWICEWDNQLELSKSDYAVNARLKADNSRKKVIEKAKKSVSMRNLVNKVKQELDVKEVVKVVYSKEDEFFDGDRDENENVRLF